MSFVQTVLQRQAEKKADEQRRRRERKRKKGGGPAEVLLRKILKKQNYKFMNIYNYPFFLPSILILID